MTAAIFLLVKYITVTSIWQENMLRYLSTGIICSEKQTVFQERCSRKTVSYEEQIMSKDKYPSIFLPQMEAIVFIILQIFFATRAVLKIGEYSRIFPSCSWGIFGHVTCLDQTCTSEKIWWIIISNIEWGWVGYEEFCRSRRVLSTKAKDNTLQDLQNSSYPTKANFIALLLIFKIFSNSRKWAHCFPAHEN